MGKVYCILPWCTMKMTNTEYLTNHQALPYSWGFPGGSVGKASAYSVGDPSSITRLGRALAKEMATHSSILAWRIPGTEKSGRLQSIGSQRVGHNESDLSLALDVTAFPFHSIWTPKLVIYWVGQKVHSGFSIRCYEKTWMNILANSTLFFLHNLIICQVLLI